MTALAPKLFPVPRFVERRTRSRWGCLAACGLLLVAQSARLQGQSATSPALRPQAAPVAERLISLDEALRLAESTSEQIAISRAGVERATGQETQARAELLPQLSGSASYDRTLATEFSGLFDASAGPPCDPFALNPSAPLETRVVEIERAIDCGAIGGNLFGGDGGDVDLPFGRKNIYRLNLSFSQNLYSGGRIGAQRALAAVGSQLAEITLTGTRAQVALDVTRAYYDAALSEHMLGIAEAGLRQATATLEQVELAHQTGRLPEFELLRARVARDNQRPIVLRARSQRTLAYLRLRQLLHLPDAENIRVAANLEDRDLPAPAPLATRFQEVVATKGQPAPERVAVRQALAAVSAREAGVRLARSQRLPSVNANSSYGRVAYSGVPSDFRNNWTVGVLAQLPILTGGRIRGDEMVARADLSEARAQLEQARSLASLDTRAAFEELDASLATWQASAGTVEQAQRAYQIAELRYREGISTQLELSDARFLLEQAQANRAQAARDLQVARAHVALLPDLPLGASGGSTIATGAGTGSAGSGVTPGGAGVRGGQQQQTTRQGTSQQAGPGGMRQ